MEEEETGRLLGEQFRTVAVSALGNATVHGGDVLTIAPCMTTTSSAKKLGRAEMEAMAPYLRDSTRLRTLVLSGTELSKDGMEVLVQALETNTTVTALDLPNDSLWRESAKIVAELLARCVRVLVFVLFCLILRIACANFILRPAHHIRHYTGATMGNKTPQRQPHGITHGDTSGNTHLDNTNDNTRDNTNDITADGQCLQHHLRHHHLTTSPSTSSSTSPPTLLTTSPSTSLSFDIAFDINIIAFDTNITLDISDMGALTSLNLSSNSLAYGADMSGNMLKLPV
jgi:hypothetical protein